jgi:hypothetical protein
MGYRRNHYDTVSAIVRHLGASSGYTHHKYRSDRLLVYSSQKRNMIFNSTRFMGAVFLISYLHRQKFMV